ncbi:MAG: bifunctional 2-polyprenyl-6-hydroxyphenol methylase/3-demethylubiquinol 3-O-methyltransferase UbiG [Gammaproteobacteria bacterium WSBS_2016_MAG_OTU1]
MSDSSHSSAQQFFDGGDWWNRDGAFRLLHDINPLRLRLTEEALGGSFVGRRILDIGCGGGIFTEAVAGAGARVVGCDISPGAIEAAKAHAAQTETTVEYRTGGIDTAETGQYDAVTCFEMLEHVSEPAQVIADAATMLRPNGVAIFSTINRTLPAWGLMIAGLEYALKILPHGTHDYARFITPAELAKMCESSGLAVRRVCGMHYSFFGRAYILQEDKTPCNYFLIAQRR